MHDLYLTNGPAYALSVKNQSEIYSPFLECSMHSSIHFVRPGHTSHSRGTKVLRWLVHWVFPGGEHVDMRSSYRIKQFPSPFTFRHPPWYACIIIPSLRRKTSPPSLLSYSLSIAASGWTSPMNLWFSKLPICKNRVEEWLSSVMCRITCQGQKLFSIG